MIKYQILFSFQVILSLMVILNDARANTYWACENSYSDEINIFNKQAVNFSYKSTGFNDGNKWRLNSNGYIEDQFHLDSNSYVAVALKAKAVASQNGHGNYWPRLQISIDGRQVANLEFNDPANFQNYYIYLKQPGINRSPVFPNGNRKIRITYRNDWADHSANQGRDIRIEKVLVYVEKDGCSLPREFKMYKSLNKVRAWSRQLGFPLGVILNESGGVSPVDTDSQYRSKLKKFDYLTPSNQFKMASMTWTQNQTNYQRPDQFAEFVNQNGKSGLQGHTITWSKSLPNLSSEYEDPVVFENWLSGYINDLVNRYPTLFPVWQVINETLDWEGKLKQDDVFYGRLGPDYVKKIWNMVSSATQSQQTKLIINENKVLDLNEKSDGLYALVQSLLSQGVQVDGVGFQAHYSIGNQPDFSTVQQNIQRFVDLGLEVHITELDVEVDENIAQWQEIQAGIYYQIVSACLHTEGCSSINFWGLTDKYSYSDKKPHLLNANLKLKRAVSAVTMALKEKLSQITLID